ncbi:Pyridoxal 5'-phosphate synthase subunit PdxT [Bienertia sinuspersici]
MIKNLATQIGQVHNQGVQYQQKTDTHLQNIDTQIGQICTSLSNLESQLSGKLPSQPYPNPKEQVNRVILRDPEEANELEELEVISEESSNTIKLLDAINVVPKYQMLFEQYLSNNDIHVPNEFSKEWLSSLPVKCKDPRSFSIPCRIVLESNGEKIGLNMIDKDLIPEANATNYVANSLEQIGVDNLETILDGMVAEMGLEKLFTNALEEIDI